MSGVRGKENSRLERFEQEVAAEGRLGDARPAV
jgi:hypothetical protein